MGGGWYIVKELFPRACYIYIKKKKMIIIKAIRHTLCVLRVTLFVLTGVQVLNCLEIGKNEND